MEKIKEILTQAKQSVNFIKTAYEKAHALSSIAQAQANNGYVVEAKKTLEQATQTANSIKGSYEKAIVLSSIVQALIEKIS